MSMTLLTDEPFRLKLRDAWNYWWQHIHLFPRYSALVGPICEAENQAPFFL